MDRDTKIKIAMLDDANQSMLCVSKWEKYGCISVDEADGYIRTLCIENKVEALPSHRAFAHTRGLRAIPFDEEICYKIKTSGIEMLRELRSKA